MLKANEGIDKFLASKEGKNLLKSWSREGTKFFSDKTCRVDNAFRLAKDVLGAHVEIFAGKGHCVMFDNLEKLGEILCS